MNTKLKELNSIYAFGYGLFVYSSGTFNEWIREKKCRARKMLSYLDRRKELFFDMIDKGVALPIYHILAFRYPIFVTLEEKVEIPEGWYEVFCYEDWFITVGKDEKLCFSNFDFFEYHGGLIAKGQCVYTGEVIGRDNKARLFYHSDVTDMPEGHYRFDVYGLKRERPYPETDAENFNRNTAYLFAFRKVDDIRNENLERCDNDTHVFDIERYEKEILNKDLDESDK